MGYKMKIGPSGFSINGKIISKASYFFEILSSTESLTIDNKFKKHIKKIKLFLLSWGSESFEDLYIQRKLRIICQR